jgi:hypothetical protein
VFTRLLNQRYARTMARIQLLSGQDGAEDTNYPDQQFSYFTITSGINNYQFLTDEDGNTITDITGVLLQPPGASDYVPLNRLALSDPNALLIMSPNASQTGTPTGYIEKNNTIFFDVLPNYGAAEGGKMFYRLVPSYFVVGDTTKKPGFVDGYHRVLSLGGSLDWLLVNKAEAVELIESIKADLKETNADLETYIRQKNPTRAVIRPTIQSSR